MNQLWTISHKHLKLNLIVNSAFLFSNWLGSSGPVFSFYSFIKVRNTEFIIVSFITHI